MEDEPREARARLECGAALQSAGVRVPRLPPRMGNRTGCGTVLKTAGRAKRWGSRPLLSATEDEPSGARRGFEYRWALRRWVSSTPSSAMEPDERVDAHWVATPGHRKVSGSTPPGSATWPPSRRIVSSSSWAACSYFVSRDA